MTNGYDFYFKDGTDVLTFPITPDKLSIKIGSNNKTITLINEGDINIPKSPSLIEVEFEARFPMRQYPYAREFSSFETYFNKFAELKEKKKAFRFIVARAKPNGVRTWDTNLLMALEDFNLNEDSKEGDDVIIKFKLKQYKEYGVKKLPSSYLTNTVKTSTPTSTSTSTTNRSNESIDTTKSKTHVVQSGDNLWAIARKYYNDETKWKVIYETNKTVIEDTAKKYGKASSSNGHWIYPGTVLVIPDANTANTTAQQLNQQQNNTTKRGSGSGVGGKLDRIGSHEVNI